MKVEIWSDIMCPFCYIGKRQFEAAMKQFPDRDSLEIIWKSFQLDPTIPDTTVSSLTSAEYLSERKGLSLDRIEAMHVQVSQMAENVGLEYHLENTRVYNTFKAHRLIQLAKTKGLGDEAEEIFFHAHFTLNRDLDDTKALIDAGKEIGLSEAEVTDALTDHQYEDLVNQDIREARQIGVTGVPFFVFNRKYAVSGAQPASAFLETLTKSFAEWRKENPSSQLNVTAGNACTPDGECNIP